MTYDANNIFARILRGDIPARKVYEDDAVLAFDDINPQAPVHTLVIPKVATVDWNDSVSLDDATLAALWRAVPKVAALKGVAETGYRVIVNIGADSHSEVPHLHLHILGGKPVGPLLVIK